MTKERPIPFGTDMVLALLAGRKTQTRRTRGLKEINENPENWKEGPVMRTCRFWDADKEENPNPLEVHYSFFHKKTGGEFKLKCPYGKPGDLLWVRESTWLRPNPPLHPEFWERRYCAGYDSDEPIAAGFEKKPSIHMPKAAARIWLEVTEVRVERLGDISKEDAIAEGVDTYFNSIVKQDCYRDYLFKGEDWMTPEGEYYYPGYSFRSLWESINGSESWDLDPWVWVVEFKVVSTTGRENVRKEAGAV